MYSKDMGSACVYEEKTVIHELTQGIQMAKQLKVNLHSPEAREFLIQKILSSYENALFFLNSGNPAANVLPAGSLPESSLSNGSLGSEEFKFDKLVSGQQGENVIFKKRRFDQVSICSKDGLAGNTDNGSNWRKHGQKRILGTNFSRSNFNKHTSIVGAQSASPPPPPPLSPEKQEIMPTHKHQHRQPLPPNPGEMFSDLRANLGVDTSDLGGHTYPSLFSLNSTSFGIMDYGEYKNF